MKTGIFIFTYGGDEAIARKNLSVLEKSLANHQPKEDLFGVFVLDDANNPWKAPLESSKTLAYIKTDFNRMGNLNGCACAEGMLSVMAAITISNDLDYIVKLDSDTVLLRPAFGFGKNYCGSSENRMRDHYGYGSCYSISRTALLSAYALTRLSGLNPSCAMGEDFIIGNLVHTACKGRDFLITNIDDINGLSRYWGHDQPCQCACAVSCKPGRRRKEFKWTEEEVLERMDFLAENYLK